MSQPISIPRTGDTSLTFAGQLIDRFAGASPSISETASAPIDDVRRRLEVYLYQTDSGNYVVWVICRSESGGEVRRSDAYVGCNAEDLVQRLRGDACLKAIIGAAPGKAEEKEVLERELRAHWENVVQLIDWSIQDREKARHNLIHQAGLTVARCRLNVPEEMEPMEAEQQQGEMEHPAPTAGAASEGHVADQLLTLATGYGALRAAGYAESDARRGAQGEIKRMQELLESGRLGALDEWLARGVNFMKKPENVRAVELVAEELRTHGKLRDGIDELIDVADGKIPMEEYEWVSRRSRSAKKRQRPTSKRP